MGDGPLAEDIVEKRCAEATRVLERLPDLMDCQGEFQMLRLCGGFARLVYAIRCSPAGGSFDQLEAMDSRIREAFLTITRLPMDQEAWARAQRGGSAGGLGIRSLVRDSPCAFISSVLASMPLQERMAPGTELADIMGEPAFQHALRALRGALPLPLVEEILAGKAVPQRVLTRAMDANALEGELLSTSMTPDMRTHLGLVASAGTDSWLMAPPCEEAGTQVDSELFRIALGRRLRVPLNPGGQACPCCGAQQDRYMDHALVCACGGDRTRRHNAVRDTICSLARNGGLQAQLEKGGLLPARHPSEEGRGGGAQDRRPADVWLPSGAGPENRPLAIDVATTSGMRQYRWTVTLGESAGVFLGDYETWKIT